MPPQNEYDVSKGYTYLYFKGVPLYAFGHGLSYTKFKYDNLKVSQSGSGSTRQVAVSFDLKNIGSRGGAEVAQLYTHQQRSNVRQPIQSLRAFRRITLEPGESKHVTFDLPVSELAFYDVSSKQFIVSRASST